MNNRIEINHQLFAHSDSLAVRSVQLNAGDSLQAHREKLAKVVLDDMYQFVALLDARGILLEVNRAALEGAGIRLEDIQGKPFWEARWWQVSEDTIQRQKEVCARAAQGEFIRYDVEIYGQGGGDETIIIDYSLIPVKDSKDRVVFLLAEGRNITEKKKADAEIARKNQELQQLLKHIQELDELKSQFFANVSHELRTPLALILGPAEKVLREGDYLDDAHRQDVQVIRRNASTLLKHVNDLLDISKLDAGKMTAQYERTDLAHLVHAVAGHFDAIAADRAIRFAVDTPPALSAEIDRDKIERVLLNLLSNAFKFTPAGGRIKLALQLSGAVGRALILVQDSGPGVREEDRALIFERFRQSDGGSTRQFGGTGLGLSIARDFIGMHGGVVSVTDAPGGGALFQVEIPLQAPEGRQVLVRAQEADSDLNADGVAKGIFDELMPIRGTVRRENASHPAAAGQPTILVVEDNHELNRFIVDNLSRAFRVVTAFDGEEGLRLAAATMPDLVITDIMMPKMSGSEMIRRLREDQRFDGIPVLVLSAKADDELRLRLLAHDAQDYVVKPFSAPELLARARNLVTMKRSQEQLAAAARQLEAQSREKSQQLRQNEHRFRLMVESVKDYALFMLAPDGKVAGWNLGAERLTGYREADVLGTEFSVFYTEDDRQRMRPAADLDCARQQGQYAGEGIRVRSNGTTYHAQVIISRIDAGDGSPRGFVQIIRDVSERSLAQEALKKSESKLKWLIESNIIGVAQYRYDGMVSDPNDAFLRMLGITREEFARNGLSWRAITPPEWLPADMKAWERLRACGVVEPFEKELYRKDGSRAAIFVGAANFEGSRDEGIAYVLDVSDIRKAELALKESEAKFRTIANAMPQMVWSTLPDGYHDYYNDRWYEFTGVPAGSTDGDEWNGMFHPDDQERAWRVWRHSLETGAPYEIEYRLRHRSGQYRWTLGRALPVRNERGDIVRWMGTCTDIHEQKTTQEALRQSDRRKDEFLAMLAHELRNPLAPVMAAAELLSVSKPDEAKLRRISDVICRQTGHMTGLIEDLLDVSRVTRGLVTIEKLPVDLKEVVAEAVEQARPVIEARSHRLSLQIAPQPAMVAGDRKRLVQVLTNILNNAAKYTPEHGEIRLVLDVKETGDIVTLSVRDNGVGMSADLAARAFELFEQGARTSDRALGGLGIGLALVRSLVHLHGGTVTAHSEGLDRGSEIAVSLPRLHGPVRANAERSASARPRGGAICRRVLVVDDNVDAAQMLAMLLETAGYETLVEHRPGRAIERARMARPDVCLLDIGLPEMDGYDLAQHLKTLPGMDGVRLAALTGYGQPKDVDRSLNAGFARHFVKPVDAKMLLGWLAEIAG